MERRRVPDPLALAVPARPLLEPMRCSSPRRLRQGGAGRHFRCPRPSLSIVVGQFTRAGTIEYPHVAPARSSLCPLPPDEAVVVLQKRSAALASKIDESRVVTSEPPARGVGWHVLIGQRCAPVVMEAERASIADLIQSVTAPGYVRSWQATMGSRS